MASRFAQYQVAIGSDGRSVELGRGAMGTTYRAWDTVLRSAVALKVVCPEVGAHPKARARFLRQTQAAAGLRHPHVASVFFGERSEDRQPFYAMELVEGETLEARVRRAGGLPVGTVLEIGAQVADALAAAEACGLTHRDLKPSNLMVAEGEATNVKVIDFGLARAAAQAGEMALTNSEAFIGTPAFASPEQFGSGDGGDAQREVDTRSDFYALGATLWYALTGRAPVSGATLAEIHERPPAPGTTPRRPRARADGHPAVLVALGRPRRPAADRPRFESCLGQLPAAAACRARSIPRLV